MGFARWRFLVRRIRAALLSLFILAVNQKPETRNQEPNL